jgi:hypothetical protein
MGTFVIESTNFSLESQINNRDFAPISNDDSPYISIIKSTDYATTPLDFAKKNLCFNEFLKNAISFEVPTPVTNVVTNVVTTVMKTYGGDMTTTWNGLNTAFPSGFIILSPEQVIDTLIEKTISFSIYNKNIGAAYNLNIEGISTVLLYNDVLNNNNPGKFKATYTVYNPGPDKVIYSGPVDLGPQIDLRYLYKQNLTNIYIPTNGYITFRVTRDKIVQDIDVYLLISLNGIETARPVISFSDVDKNIVTTFEKQNDSLSKIEIDITQNIAGDSLINAEIELLFTNTVVGSSPISSGLITLTNNTKLSYTLPSRFLNTGTYSVFAKYSNVYSAFPNYFSSNSTTALTYTIGQTSLSTTLVTPLSDSSTYSYDSDISFTAAVKDTDSKIYTYTSIPGIMTLHWGNSNRTETTHVMDWDATTSKYKLVLKPSKMKLYTGETYSFYTTFVSSNTINYNCSNSSSPSKTIIVTGLQISATDNNTTATNKIGLTETILITLNINDIGDITKKYPTILGTNGTLNIDIYSSTGTYIIGKANIGSSYILDPKNPDLQLKLVPGDYYAIFTFTITNTDDNNIVVNDSAYFEFTIDENKLYILNESLTKEYGLDLTITASIKSNSITLTRDEISGGSDKITNVKFEVYEGSSKITTSNIASYDAATKIYSVALNTKELVNTNYTIKAVLDQTNSTNIYLLSTSADKSVIITPQSINITITKPDDSLSVADTDVLYRYTDDVYVDKSNYIFEYYWNTSFTINGTINIKGELIPNNIQGQLQLYLKDSVNDTYTKIIDNTIIQQTDNTPTEFTLTVTSPAALGVIAGSANRQFYIQWVPTNDKLYNIATSVNSTNSITYIRSMKAYTIFNSSYNCVCPDSTITYEKQTTFTGQVIEYKRTSINGNDDPSNGNTSPVLGTYELKYFEFNTTIPTLFKSFGTNGHKITKTNYDTNANLTFDSSLYVSGSTTNQLTVGTYYVRMFFTPTNTSQYNECYSSTTRTITISQEPILRPLLTDMTMYNNTTTPASEVTSAVDNNTPVYFVIPEIKSVGKSTVLSGTFDFYVGSDVLLYSNLTDSTPPFTSTEKDIISGSSITFKAVFTPSNLNFAQVILYLAYAFSQSSLIFNTLTIPATLNYELPFTITGKLLPFKKGDGTNLSITGKFRIKEGNNELKIFENISINDDSQLTVFSGTPKDLKLNVGSYNITVIFEPNNKNIGSSNKSSNTIITKKQINSTTITIDDVSSISKSYDEVLTITATIPVGITGNIQFIMIIDVNTSITLGTLAINPTTGKVTLTKYGYDLAINTNIAYTIRGEFTSTDSNYDDGQETQNTVTITFIRTDIYLSSLSINGETQSLTSDYYKSGISVKAGNSITFSGKLTSSKNPSKAVKFGKITLLSNILSAIKTPTTVVINSDGTFSFTQTIGSSNTSLSISTAYYLRYTNDVNDVFYNTRSLLHTISPFASPSIPGKYYINIDEISYKISMKRTEISTPNYTTDYHDGNIQFTVEIDQNLIPESKTIYAPYNKDGKGGIVFMIMNTSGVVIHRHEVQPEFDTAGNKTFAVWTFSPLKLTSVLNSTNGLQIGSYNLKAYFEGIPTYYRSQDATYTYNGNTQYTLPFEIIKTIPTITSSLTYSSVNYKDQPYLKIKIQTPISNDNIQGITTLTYRGTTSLPLNVIEHIDSTNGTVSTALDLAKITNILGTKIVRMPIIPASSSSYTILLAFTPNDNVNYSAQSYELSYTVSKYTPVIENITIVAAPEGNVASNVFDSRDEGNDYVNGVINYDEPIQVSFNINKKDKNVTNMMFNTGYESIAVSNIEYKYKHINPLLTPSTYKLFSPLTDFNETYNPTDTTKLTWKAVIKAQQIDYSGEDDSPDYTLQIIYTPSDTINYESKTVSIDFSIYLANALGTLKFSNYNDIALPFIYNVSGANFTIGANIQYLSTVDTDNQVAELTLYYDYLVDSNKLNAEPVNIPTSGNYTISFPTGDVSKLLTARNDPYIIYGLLDPVLDNYPSIKQTTPFSLQINPSVEISITNEASESSPPSAEYNRTPFLIKATIKTGNTDTYSGTITFTIKKSTTTVYTTTINKTNVVTDNEEFSFSTGDKNEDGSAKYDLPLGTYSVSCSFASALYSSTPITQNTIKTFTVTKRIAPFKIELTSNRIVFKDTQPTITATFTEDDVYDGSIIFTFEHKSGLSSHAVSNFTYTLPTILSTKKKVYNSISLPSNMNADDYKITATFSGSNFDTSTSASIVFVISKKNVTITPISKYYSTSIIDKLPNIGATTNVDVKSGNITVYNSTTGSSIDIEYTSNTANFELGTTIPLSNLGISTAGSYEIAMFYKGNDTLVNYNKSPIVFTNLIVKRAEVLEQALELLSSPSTTTYDYTFSASNTNIATGDKVELYAIAYNGALRVNGRIHDTTIVDVLDTFTCPDDVFDKGDTQIYAIITNSNYIIKTSLITIAKPAINITSLTLTRDSTGTVYCNTPILLTATVLSGRQGATVNDGRVIFYVKDNSTTPVYTTIASANVINNIAELPNVLLTKIGSNTICAKYMDSFIYNDFPSTGYSSSELVITLVKANTTVELTSTPTITLNQNLTTILEIKATLQIGTFVQSGTIQFKDGNDIIYDYVPVIDGVATIKLYVDKAYSLTAIYSGNEYLNASVSSTVLNITLAAQQTLIDANYENPSYSINVYNATNSTTSSVTITANISAKVKKPVYDNSGYFIFKVGEDERTIYAKEISSLSAIYTASTSYTYTASPVVPSIVVTYGNHNYSGVIIVPSIV